MLKPHPKWGMNPTHIGCFGCGTRSDRVFLFGDSIEKRAEPVTLFDSGHKQFWLCPTCDQTVDEGIIYIQCKRFDNEKGYKRTGKYIGISEKGVRHMYPDKASADKALDSRIQLIFSDTWEKLGFDQIMEEMKG